MALSDALGTQDHGEHVPNGYVPSFSVVDDHLRPICLPTGRVLYHLRVVSRP